MKRSIKFTLIVVLAIWIVWFLLHLRGSISQRAFDKLLPQITAITLYDIHDPTPDSNALFSATSARFPVEAFRRACTSATNESGVAIWKGSSLVVFTLSDGKQRRARFSYYGGFFTVDGFSGHFVAPGRGTSEFQRLHSQLIQDQFIPKRREGYKTVMPSGQEQH
jgi:hypothetical protein